jgi:hypothetical protein
MAPRLTLNTAGIKSPLDVGEGAPVIVTSLATAPKPGLRPAPLRPKSPTAAPALPPTDVSPPEVSDRRSATHFSVGPFYGGGRPLQTSIALNAAHLDLLDELARAGALSVNAIAVAALHAGLPRGGEAAREAMLEERLRRVGEHKGRLERNLRLPEQLRARVDELTAGSRERLRRANRADLVNASLARGLPQDAEAAAAMVDEYARQLERAAAA